jgi:diaminopimelate epimerase
MSGAGNTFYILDEREKTIEIADRPAFVRKLCQETVGVATDGVVFLKPSAGLDFAWEFYNSDGSVAEMCGNAARCASLYVFQKAQDKKEVRFLTLAGQIQAERLGPVQSIVQIRVQLPESKIVSADQSVRWSTKQGVRGFFVNTGVPHFVIEGHPDEALAQKIRNAKEFEPAGTNVTFVQRTWVDEAKQSGEVEDPYFAQAVTFERGVEGFTLACGTGAVAAAAFLKYEIESQKLPLESSFDIEMPGGLLTVAWNGNQPSLEGPTEFLMIGHIPKESL